MAKWKWNNILLYKINIICIFKYDIPSSNPLLNSKHKMWVDNALHSKGSTDKYIIHNNDRPEQTLPCELKHV